MSTPNQRNELSWTDDRYVVPVLIVTFCGLFILAACADAKAERVWRAEQAAAAQPSIDQMRELMNKYPEVGQMIRLSMDSHVQAMIKGLTE